MGRDVGAGLRSSAPMSQFGFDVVCLSLKIGGSFSTPPKLTLPIHWRSSLVRQGLFHKIIFLTQRLILKPTFAFRV
jgi:hypothetical protein